LESVGCAWYSWLHSKTATNCYGNNRFSSLSWQAWKQVIYTASRIFFLLNQLSLWCQKITYITNLLLKKKIYCSYSA
jgi:hypothetical protein